MFQKWMYPEIKGPCNDQLLDFRTPPHHRSKGSVNILNTITLDSTVWSTLILPMATDVLYLNNTKPHRGDHQLITETTTTVISQRQRSRDQHITLSDQYTCGSTGHQSSGTSCGSPGWEKDESVHCRVTFHRVERFLWVGGRGFQSTEYVPRHQTPDYYL